MDASENHRYFQDRPLTHPDATNEHLIMWIFEDYLKKTFWKFVQLLKILSDDPVVHVRHRMLGFIAELMSSKPEQENTLLEMLVNKMVRLSWLFNEEYFTIRMGS